MPLNLQIIVMTTRRNSIGKKRCSRGKRTVTDAVKQTMSDTFHLLDKRKEGVIEASQLFAATKICGLELTGAVAERAVTNDLLGINEYMSYMLSMATAQDHWCAFEMKDLFDNIDRERCGYITDAQIKRTFARIGEHLTNDEIELEVCRYFANLNHQIDYDSFIMLLSSESI